MALFKKKGYLGGRIKVANVPPFVGYSLSLSVFKVKGLDAPSPYPDVAPPEARTNEADLCELIHFDREDTSGHLDLNFRIRRSVGWYYLQLNIILYRKQGEKSYAHVERFPFVKRPVEFLPDGQDIVLPVSWPETPIEELEHYGTVSPK